MTGSNRPQAFQESHFVFSGEDTFDLSTDSLFKYIVQQAPVSMYIMSEGKFVYVNECFCNLLAYSKEDLLSGNVQLEKIIHPEDFPIVQSRIQGNPEMALNNLQYRVKLVKSDGNVLYAEVHSSKVNLGGDISYIGSISDVTEEVMAQNSLKESEDRYNSFFLKNPDAIFSFDMEGNFIDVNPGGVALSGYSQEELLEMSFIPMVTPGHLDKALYFFSDSLTGKTNRFEIDLFGKDNKLLHLEVTCFPVLQAGKITGVYGIAKDITSRNENRRLLDEIAFFDQVTKLPNRKLFEDRLEQAFKIPIPSGTAPAILFLNLDRFKNINDSLGYDYGDLFLKQAAIRMLNCVDESATVSRFAGDEFAILLPDSTTEEAVVLAKHLNKVLAEPVDIRGQHLSLTVSVGVACSNAKQDDLIKQAEAAMLYTKKYSKSGYSFYSLELTKEIDDKLAIEKGLQSAIRNNEFLLHYQPIMDLNTGKLSAMEALIRWNHSELGPVPPDRFIPVSEKSGQIVAIGKWVLHTACLQNKKWQSQGYPPFRICVNISTIQLQHPGFVHVVNSILKETGLDAKWLELEVTESILLEDTEVLRESLHKLKALGISMSIDDFGTGFTSLNYLRQFSFDRVKVDRSFVQDINNDLNGKTITSTIITLAHKLGMEVVAEGIEDTVQLEYLNEELCNEGQGFYFSRPKPADQHDLLKMDLKK